MTLPGLFIHQLLTDRWSATYTDRINDVPEPEIRYAKDDPTISVNDLQQADYLHVMPGGVQNREPAGISYTEENWTDRVTVDLRCPRERKSEAGYPGGRDRMYGAIDGSYDFSRYGGLAGEVRRVVHSARRGLGGYDQLVVEDVTDLSDEMGHNVWRAAVEIRLDRYSRPVSP